MTFSASLFFRDLDHFAALILTAMRAGAMRKLGFVAIGAFGVAQGAQMVMSTARGGALLGVSSFRIRHLVFLVTALSTSAFFGLQFLERGPAFIHELGFASAVYQVPILTAHWANPVTIGAANPLHRHAKQNMLPQYVF
jgi:hypothetical protein